MQKIELLHCIADTLRQGGSIEVNYQGELELRTTNIIKQLLKKLAKSEESKIDPAALSKVSMLVSEVAAGLNSSTKPEIRQDLEDVKNQLARSYFGRSQYQPLAVLLEGTPSPLLINIPSFCEIDTQASIEVNLSLQADKVNPRLHSQCSKLFVELIQQAICEGKKGHYHIEHTLFFLAEQLMADYYNQLMDPDITIDSLNKKLEAIYNSVLRERSYVFTLDNSFYQTIGGLDNSVTSADRAASLHIKLALKYAHESNDPALSIVMEAMDQKSIKETLISLQRLPKTNNSFRICLELTSALRFQTLASTRFSIKQLEAPWARNLFLRLLKDRVWFVLQDATYDHNRLSSHQMHLRSQVISLEKDIENHVIAIQTLFVAGLLNEKILITARQALQKLTSELQSTKVQLDHLQSGLKKKNIDSEVLDHPLHNSLPEQLIPFLDLLDDEVLTLPSEGLESKISNFKIIHDFLLQREADFEEILPDPLANYYD